MKLKAVHFALFLLAVSFAGISCDRHKWGETKVLLQEPSHDGEKHDDDGAKHDDDGAKHEKHGKDGDKGAHEKKDGSEKKHP